MLGSFIDAAGDTSAFLYRDGRMIDLTPVFAPKDGSHFWGFGMGINDSGQIVLNLENADLTTHALLLTPVPESSTYSLLAAGLGVLGLLARRRKRLSSPVAAG